MSVDTDTGSLLMQLRDAGERLRGANRHSPEGQAAKILAYDDIRAWGAEAFRLGVTKRKIAETVAISATQLDNILTGRTKLVRRDRNPEALDVAQQLRVLAEWIRDPNDDTRPPVETADALDAAVRILVAS